MTRKVGIPTIGTSDKASAPTAVPLVLHLGDGHVVPINSPHGIANHAGIGRPARRDDHVVTTLDDARRAGPALDTHARLPGVVVDRRNAVALGGHTRRGATLELPVA